MKNQMTTTQGIFRVEDVTVEPRKQLADNIEVAPPKIRGFEVVHPLEIENKTKAGKIQNFPPIMPQQATKGSAGYDIFIGEALTLEPNIPVIVWTNIKAYMQVGEVAKAYPRSGLATKQQIILANIVGVVDQDYYCNEDNDGNIGIALLNNGTEDVTLEANSAVCQIIFEFALRSDNCNSTKERKGGFGSTTQVTT